MSVTDAYQRLLDERGYASDPAQLRAWRVAAALLRRVGGSIAPFQRGGKLRVILPSRAAFTCMGRGTRQEFSDGLLLQRGAAAAQDARLHFHEFMREVHRELQDLKGTANPLDELGRRIARRFRLICFDEFHVADVTDAMILHRLLESLFANRVSIVATSNFHPDELVPERPAPRPHPARDRTVEGQARDRLCVDNGVDYRRRTLEQVQLYHTPLGRPPTRRWPGPSSASPRRDDDPLLRIEQRGSAWLARRRRGLVRLPHAVRRAAVAERLPRAREPFSHRAAVGRAGDVAAAGLRGPALTWLVDVLYDRRVKLILSAEVAPEALYTEGPLVHEFPRTVSRLREMQSAEFMARSRRDVDTSLT